MASAFLGFLSRLPPAQIDRLYHSPWACLAVLRALPPLAKHYVMRLLYVEAGLLAEPCTLKPNPLNPEPQSLNPMPETRNSKPYALNPKL
jgi:hypothetical protein